MRLWQAVLLTTVMAGVSSPLLAVKSRSVVNFHHFPVTPLVAKQVRFWETIFTRYPDTSAVIHDESHPELIIDLIDFHRFSKRYGKAALTSRKKRNKIVDSYVNRYQLALERFRKQGKGALRYGAIEERVFKVYRKDSRALAKLFKGQVRIRSQGGLSNEFNRAAKRADKLIPGMERIFRAKRLPSDLTRLAFVESMFNLNARSKVGASGIWQFMPRTARQFMTVNHYIDERNSPFKATAGAARYLGDHYRHLKSWPLAITAYNHGRGGMSRAVRKVGTKHFDRIIRNYKSRSFGFASKNFYAEFLAARNVYNRLHRPGRIHKLQKPVAVPVKLRRSVSVSQILRYTPLNVATLKRHNPCLLPKAYTALRYRALPVHYTLYVPRHLAKKVKVALTRIRPPKKHKRLRS